MKKCPQCTSISSDSELFCGVCGGSLSGVTSESLEQLVQKEPKVWPRRKSNLSALALFIVALTMTVAGAALLVLANALGVVVANALGLFLLPAGLVIMLYIGGGPGIGIGRGKWRMQREEDREEEEELKRRRGEED